MYEPAVEDVDGHHVRCRVAQASLGECAQVCLTLLPSTLNETAVSYIAMCAELQLAY